MATTHPILVQLKEKRLSLHRSQIKVAEEARISRSFVSHHENDKFSARTSLDRWCASLGYRIVLEDVAEDEDEELKRCADWHLLIA
jgi:hypothetical protein